MKIVIVMTCLTYTVPVADSMKHFMLALLHNDSLSRQMNATMLLLLPKLLAGSQIFYWSTCSPDLIHIEHLHNASRTQTYLSYEYIETCLDSCTHITLPAVRSHCTTSNSRRYVRRTKVIYYY